VPTYAYRCPQCGPFELVRPMAASDAAADCPRCSATSTRVFAAPALRALHPGVRAALERDERSADGPDVVSALPSAGHRGRRVRHTTDPRHARLPRP
jgi:putative FmdB family regulatory protein